MYDTVLVTIVVIVVIVLVAMVTWSSINTASENGPVVSLSESNKNAHNDKFVTIRTSTLPVEASIMRSILESNGIPVRLLDENIVNTHPLYALAVGGVKIQVPQHYVQEANEILVEHGEYVINREVESENEDYIEGVDFECSNCGQMVLKDVDVCPSCNETFV